MRPGAMRGDRIRHAALSSVLIVVALVLSGCLGSQRASSGGATAGVDPHKWTAEQLASKLLTGYVPPPSAVRLSKAPNSSISSPWSVPGTMELIDQDRIWRATGNMTTVESWIYDHTPAGWTKDGSGTIGQLGRKPPGSIGNEVGTFVAYQTPSELNSVVSSQALFSVVPDGERHVFIRMDIQVIWLPTRPLWSFVSTGADKVTVSFRSSGRHRVTSSTQAFVVASFRSAVNAMTISTATPHTCLPSWPSYSVRFGGPTNVLAITSEGCITTLRVRGHPVLEMSDPGGRLLAAVEHLIP